MRRRVFLPIFLLPFAVACANILGDFTVGTGGDAGDTGTDGVPPNDGGPDGTPQDSGDADVVVPKTMKCAEDKNARVKINATTGQRVWDLVALGQVNQQKLRVVASEGNVIHGYTLDGNHNVAAETTTQGLGVTQQVLDIERLPDRFIALTYDFDGSNNPVFALYTLRDSDGAFTKDFLTIPYPLPPNADRIQGQVFPVDVVNGVYFVVVFDLEVGGSQATLHAGNEKIAAPQGLAVVDTSQPPLKYELRPPVIVADQQNAFVMLSANGPSSSDALLYVIPLQSPGTIQPRKLVPQVTGATFFPMAFANSPQQGLADLGVIEADLNNLQAQYHVGQVSMSNLGTFSPDSLPATTPPQTDSGVTSIPDLVIDKSSSHFEYFPTPMSENLLAMSRTADLNGPLTGFNFEWWDVTNGAIRARQTGSTNLLNDVQNAHRGTVLFQAAPLGALASFHMAYEVEPTQNNQDQPGDLFYTSLTCSLQ